MNSLDRAPVVRLGSQVSVRCLFRQKVVSGLVQPRKAAKYVEKFEEHGSSKLST
jgi:hypothetical protein